MKSRPLRWFLSCLLGVALGAVAAQEPNEDTSPAEDEIEIEALGPGEILYSYESGLGIVTNEFVVRFQDATLTAQRGQFDEKLGEFVVEGRVTLQRDNQVWRGEALRYNYLSRRIETSDFRAGRSPFYAAGQGLTLDLTNQVYVATNAFLTSDDVANPKYRIRARRLKISPGRYFEARDAVAYLGGVPVFYFPYLRRNLDRESNRLYVTPGYRSRYGAYLLGLYDWHWDRDLHGTLHLDYRIKRGFGGGADTFYDLHRWGKGEAQFYYLHDLEADSVTDTDGLPYDVSTDRHWFYFKHQAAPWTNLNANLVLREQSDAYVTRDFLETQYRENTQPGSYLEVNRFWPNFSLNTLVQPQINPFFETVERLPDVRLTALRQQVGSSPLYYESDSSVGYYRRNFADGSTHENYAAFRADTMHQLLLPQTFFGWLNFTPRVGGRATYYGEEEGHGTLLEEQGRTVFHTGAELSFKASRLWSSTTNRWLQVDGIRHIVQPTFTYAYVPEPSRLPSELPQFDYELPSLRLLPNQFPDYYAIDSIDSRNVLRLGLRNKLQTKRGGQVDNLLNWDLYTDWRIDPQPDQSDFSDIFSDLDLKPRSWLTLTSEIRWDVDDHRFQIANHTMTLTPGEDWSWSFGHRYLRENPDLGLNYSHSLLMGTFYYRLSENWGFRMAHHFEIEDRTMEEQYYTVYRDFRSWTGALTFRVRDERNAPVDYSVSFTFQLKAFPRFKPGDDRTRPSMLLGS